jgi:hypothetical protein
MADGFTPPAEVRANAKRGLELRQKYNRGGTEVGVARARDLSNGASLPLETIKRMNSYFARHEVDKKGEGWGTDSAGYIAWLLWGGDAGWSWVKGILREQEKKDKATMADFANAYAPLIKADKHADGTMTVYGKATDDSIDSDSQICDATWLDTAMPQWFKSGGNIREQHSNIAAGVAKEYESKSDGHYITALVVDPVSVKKVETGVLKGFSIGIRAPRVVRDNKAANGRIIDGQIVEVSLVDRPANPNAKLIMAKSVEGESALVQVEELHEYRAPLPSDIAKKETDYESIIPARKGEPADKDLYAEVIAAAKKKFDVYPSAVANAWVVQEYKRRGGTYTNTEKREFTAQEREDMADEGTAMPDGSYPIANVSDLKNAIQAFGRAKNPAATKKHIIRRARALNAIDQLPEEWNVKKADDLVNAVKALDADTVKFDQAAFDAARRAVAQLIVAEANEMAEGADENYSLNQLIEVANHLIAWYQGEVQEGEATPMSSIEMASEPVITKEPDSTMGCKCDGCMKCAADGGCDSKMCAMHKDMHKDPDPDPDAMKSVDKCLECGCHKPAETHGRDDVTTAEMISPDQTPKSDEPDAVPAATEEVAVEEVSETPVVSEDDGVEAIVEKAVKSALESVRAEITSLRADKEAAVQKSMSLEAELATALSKTVAGGPKRTATISGAQSNEYLVKAATYKAKAQATTDPVLAKGYMQLYAEFSAKGGTPTDSAN